MTCGSSVWMVSASDDERPFYLKHSRDSMADNSAEISKTLATPLFISCMVCRGFFNDDVNHLRLADFADGNQNLITGKRCAIGDEVISLAHHCRCKKVTLLRAFLHLRHSQWLTSFKMTGHEGISCCFICQCDWSWQQHWPYFVKFLLGDSVVTQLV